MDYSKIPETITVSGDYEDREVTVDGKYLNPARSQKVSNHSPDGFNWGYGGSGPAQLALAILLHFMPEEDARARYQRFKFKVVASWPRQDFHTTVKLREVLMALDGVLDSAGQG